MKQFIFLLVLVPTLASAHTFDEIAAEVVANNPTVKAEMASARADALTRTAKNRLNATNANFGYKWPMHENDGTKLSFGLSQAFDWPGVYGARRKASAAAARANNLRIAAAERQIDLQTRMALCDLVDTNKRIALLTQIIDNLDSLAATPNLSELDQKKIALRKIAVKQQLADARAAGAAATATIVALNDNTLPDGLESLSEYPPTTLQPLNRYIAALSFADNVGVADANTLMLDARAAEMGLLPGFSVGYILEYEKEKLFQGFSFGIRLPQYSAKPSADAARMEAEAMMLNTEAADNERRSALTTTYREAEAVKAILADYENVFSNDYAQLLADSNISPIDYCTGLNDYLSAQLDYLTQLRRYNQLLLKLP